MTINYWLWLIICTGLMVINGNLMKNCWWILGLMFVHSGQWWSNKTWFMMVCCYVQIVQFSWYHMINCPVAMRRNIWARKCMSSRDWSWFVANASCSMMLGFTKIEIQLLVIVQLQVARIEHHWTLISPSTNHQITSFTSTAMTQLTQSAQRSSLRLPPGNPARVFASCSGGSCWTSDR